MKALLALADGTVFEGSSFGAPGEAGGEVVFNTSMTGYQEILTDPSYCGQLVAMTYPEIGNVGVNPEDVESGRPFVEGFIVKEYWERPSNWRAQQALGHYLHEHGIPGIQGIDTRALVRHIRTHGAQEAHHLNGRSRPEAPGRQSQGAPQPHRPRPGEGSHLQRAVRLGRRHLVAGARLPRPRSHETTNHEPSVVAYDFGIKRNILRNLVRAGCRVRVVPATTPAADVLAMKPDGIFLSNGPGDPDVGPYATIVRDLIGKRPIFGICLGHQILGLALGGRTYKLKFGHHGGNQPVMDLTTRKVEITAQNHGFAVDVDSLKGIAQLTHVNLNDQTVEGLAHAELPLFSVQYHPGVVARPARCQLSLRALHEADGGRMSDWQMACGSWHRGRRSDHPSLPSAMGHQAISQSTMPKRTDIKSILLIGSGPIVIGQACEFDYSGTQACKALKEEGYRVILINSNPATIMTDPDFADRTYIEPITAAMLERIIAAERPDALLPTIGGQTGLNAAIELAEHGILDRYGVELIGAKLPAIKKAEDRDLFKAAMERIGLDLPRSGYAHSVDEAMAIRERLGLPLIIRPSRTLGGTGGSIAAHARRSSTSRCVRGLDASPTHEVLIEESIAGWKEFELEVMRDSKDNVVIVCSIENFDPMGVHTGDSITVAPAQTLTDKEYQLMRDAALAIIREIGVDTGGSNIQFAVHPDNGRLVVIEMNPRVSRSSALASKATGFPDRQDRRQARRRLHARRDSERHHARDAGVLRADDRLRGHQDPALHLREVPAGAPTSSDRR